MTASTTDEQPRPTDVRPCKGRDCDRRIAMHGPWLCEDCELGRRINVANRDLKLTQSLLKDRLERMRR